ncbi:META domain-containing protein [Spirosoma fluminis]
MKALCLFCIAALLMSFSGCERNNGITRSIDPKDLVGTWTLIEPVTQYTTTLVFHVDPTANTVAGTIALTVNGKAPVNTYFARADASDKGRFEFGQIGSTKMAGPAEAMQFEQTYFTTLQSLNRYELISPDRLKLYSTESSGILVYKRTE